MGLGLGLGVGVGVGVGVASVLLRWLVVGSAAKFREWKIPDGTVSGDDLVVGDLDGWIAISRRIIWTAR